MVKQAKSKKASKPKPQKRVMARQANFGPVTSINTAPVSIGNSIRGTKPHVIPIKDGCRIVGRDFGFELAGTVAAASGWSLIGGFPVTPAVLPSSALRSYTQMYSKFKVNAINAHYITSSATSQTGDILFYYERERTAPCVDWTNASFLPYVLSDPNTIIGPQWMNHTLSVVPTDDFKSTDYGTNVDLTEESTGTIFLFSKTSSANSPGYIIFDYDITFKQLQVNPRAGVLPIARGQWTKSCIGVTALAVVSGTNSFNPSLQGTSVSGTTATLPTGAAAGDIYKCIFDVTNSTVAGVNAAWTNVTPSNLLRYEMPGGVDGALTVDDGFTAYLTYDGVNFRMYPTLASAYGAGNGYTYGVTATVTFNVCVMISLVGSFAPLTTQFSY